MNAPKHTPSPELDKIFYNATRGKTVTKEQEYILEWAEKRLKPAIEAWGKRQRVEARLNEATKAREVAINHRMDTAHDIILVLGARVIDLRAALQSEMEKKK